MAAVSAALDEGAVAILESPTGTGKSLSLICSTMHWLRRQDAVGHLVPAAAAGAAADDDDDEPDWLRVYDPAQEEADSRRADLARKVEAAQARVQASRGETGAAAERMWRRKRAKVSRPGAAAAAGEGEEEDDDDFALADGDGDGAEESEDDDDDDGHPGQQDKDKDVPVRKIIFCSRTHSQLRQVVHELRKTAFGADARCVTLGSRAALCVNPTVLAEGSVSRMNDKCQDVRQKKGCRFLDPASQALLRDRALASVMDIEELGDAARALPACGYYAVRRAVAHAELVAMPYNVLLHAPTRRAMGVPLAGNVVVLDEAHNLVDAINSAHSVELSGAQVEEACVQLHGYEQRYRPRLSRSNYQHVRQLLTVLDALRGFVQALSGSSTEVLQLGDFLQNRLKVDNINLVRLHAWMRRSDIARKVMGFASTGVPVLQHVQGFLLGLAARAGDGVALASAAEPRGVRLHMLNAAAHFGDVLREAHAVLLAGGTMQPVADLHQQLLRGAAAGKPVREFSCGHVIPPENLVVLPVGRHRLTFSVRGTREALADVLAVLRAVCERVPHGVVAFFPSYAYEQQVHDFAFAAAGGGGSRLAGKPLFREPRSAAEVEPVLRDFDAAARSASGALLFAVVGGRLSEGINFSDDLARCVVMVGLPFPNARDPATRAKKAYLARTSGDAAADASDLVTCMKAVNQSIGRAIRHRADYAAVVLCDQRFVEDRGVRALLPGWMAARIRDGVGLGGALGEFFGSRDGVGL